MEPADASGRTWVTFDDANLYVFVQVTDDVLGALLPPQDNKQRFRTDSIEIMIDPRGTSDNTATTFILGALPGTAVDGGVGGPVAGRDRSAVALTLPRLASSLDRSSSARAPPCMPITTSRPPSARTSTLRAR